MKEFALFVKNNRLFSFFILIQCSIMFLMGLLYSNAFPKQNIIWNILILIGNMLMLYTFTKLIIQLQNSANHEARLLIYDKQQSILQEIATAKARSTKELVTLYEKLHSQMIFSEYQNISAHEIVNKLYKEHSDLLELEICKNKTINAILYHKFMIAREKRIHISATVMIPEQIPINDMDLMLLYTNLLDNAIHAAEHSAERYIHLETRVMANHLVINVENTYDSHTTRTKQEEALGTSIISTVCAAYDGEYQLDLNELAHVNVVLNLDRKIHI